jgi:UDP-apiose/xylose synthase
VGEECVQVIYLAAICTPADYNTRPLDTIYSNLVDALPVVQYCRENKILLIHFSKCEDDRELPAARAPAEAGPGIL